VADQILARLAEDPQDSANADAEQLDEVGRGACAHDVLHTRRVHEQVHEQQVSHAHQHANHTGDAIKEDGHTPSCAHPQMEHLNEQNVENSETMMSCNFGSTVRRGSTVTFGKYLRTWATTCPHRVPACAPIPRCAAAESPANR
jgi:hypothetical protein